MRPDRIEKRRRRLAVLLAQGMTQRQAAVELGVSESVVSHDAQVLGLARGGRRPTRYDWTAIREFYEAGHTRQECRERFGFSAGAFDQAIARGDIVPRPRQDPAKHAHTTRREVERLLNEGWTQADIARHLSVSKGTVAFHVRQLGVPPDERFNRRYDWAAVQAAHDDGLRAGECCKRFGFSKATWTSAVQRGDITPHDWRLPLDQLLVTGRSATRRTHLKQRLIKAGLKEDRCERCGLTHWEGTRVNMQLHHRNGDGLDNRLENLELLCPNCHALTENWGGRNKGRNNGSGPREAQQ